MKQGDIYDVYFNPTQGSEQRGRRPAIIISGTAINLFMKTVIVVPLTTSIKNYHENLILKPTNQNGLVKISEALPIHIRAIDKTRLRKKLGAISVSEIAILKGSLDRILKY